jgi:hypothetical protein
MKTTLKKYTAIACALFLALYTSAIGPVSNYTFVNPCQPIAVFNAIPGTYGCFAFTVTNAGANDPASYYSWDFGDGTTLVGKKVYHCYSPVTNPTIYTITVGYNSPQLCGPLPTTQNYTILLNPPASTLCVLPTASITLSAKNVTVWAGSAIPEIQYSYNYGDGTPAVSNYTHQYVSCGDYIIEVKSWDMNTPQNVCYSYAAVNMACPNDTTSTGLKERDSKFHLFPNPATEKITISPAVNLSDIQVTDLTGRIILKMQDFKEAQVTIPVSEFTRGVYILKISGKDGSEKIMKFLKE